MEHRFCVDCVHFTRIELGPFTTTVMEQCRHPCAPRDHVSGSYAGALQQRLSVLGCGPDGTRWQRRPSVQAQPEPRGILWWWPW